MIGYIFIYGKSDNDITNLNIGVRLREENYDGICAGCMCTSSMNMQKKHYIMYN